MENVLKQERFVELVSRHRTQVLGYLFALVRNFGESEEFFQQLTLTLWQRFDEYDETTDFGKWACANARYLVANHWRRERRKTAYLNERASELLAEMETNDRATLGERRREALGECMEQLPNKEQSLLEDFYVEQSPAKDIALKRGLTAQSVHNALSRIRRMLFDCIGRKLEAQER